MSVLEPAEDRISEWESLVAEFSTLALTEFEKDYLVALDGIAKEFHKAIHRA